jgi:diguanylate cyclase (GGDEF)-like protein/PAS domain S-box-containing protein
MTAAVRSRLLVVDDDEASRELLARRLQRAGHEVEMASSGEEALGKVAAGAYDLVLLDRSMPRMSGVEVLNTLRASATTARLPVIMVTAEAQGMAVTEALEAGANDYVTKPVDFAVIQARVRAQLDRRHAERRLEESERRYELAAAAARDVLIDYRPVSGDLYVSPQWNLLLGLAPVSVPPGAQDWFSRVHPLDLAHLQSALESQAGGGEDTVDLEYRLRHADGTYRWVRNRSRAVTGAGDETRITGSLTDITSVKFADPLTGLATRIYLFESLGAAMERSRAGGADWAVLFLDLDGFKYVNDSLGHAAGDELLIEVAGRLRRCLPETSDVLIARLGGDEFALLVPGPGRVEARRIVAELAVPFEMPASQVYVTASVGIAAYHARYQSAHEMLRDADTAMYSAKARGKNCFEVFTEEMHAKARNRLELGNAIRDAVINREFELAFQPIVSLADHSVTGLEALLRWPAGKCNTQELVRIAEELGVISDLGQWVLEESCRLMLLFERTPGFPRNLMLNVNVSGVQFGSGLFHNLVLDTLVRTGFDPHRLSLEITETSMMKDSEGVLKSLRVMKDNGIHLAIDDFGTGYSSLSYLHQFPFGTLKLDQSFLRQATEGPGGSLEIVKAVIELSHALKMRVVAEGVETKEEAEQLRLLGCEFGQGYYFSIPVPSAEVATTLTSPRWTPLPSGAMTS